MRVDSAISPPTTASTTAPGARAQLAWDTLELRDVRGIPTWALFVMDIPFMEQATGHAPGDFRRNCHEVYAAFQNWAGCCFLDQYIPDNPLTMGERGYEADREKTATEGAGQIVRDGVRIDSAEAVVEHLEQFVFPAMERELAEPTDESRDAAAVRRMLEAEASAQRELGPDILKGMYGASFPRLRYGEYGYDAYFMTYAAYPEVIERDFSLQARGAVRHNARRARAIREGGLPRVLRLDHDMADSRGTLVDVRSLDRIWFPHFQAAIAPLRRAGIRLVWHCDGNLMAMVPRLIECGVGGFQGFQYEDGMDYPAICRMRAADGGPLLIFAGVSVTTTLPFGSPQNVRDQLRWLVENGPPTGLFLGVSSSVTPGTSRENLRALIDGLSYYRSNGRQGERVR